jgi:hypothetical protein
MKEVDGKVQENVEFTRKTMEVSTTPGHGRSCRATSIFRRGSGFV